jgi:hypothetical protein
MVSTPRAVPPGERWRVGVDWDGDGYGDEIAFGSDGSNQGSHP